MGVRFRNQSTLDGNRIQWIRTLNLSQGIDALASEMQRSSQSYPPIREGSEFTQGAVASRKCAALIALKLGELVVQFCHVLGGGRVIVERFK